MAIESIRIRGVGDNGPDEAAIEVALDENPMRVELSVVRDDGVEVWATVRIADLVSALQVLRSSQGDEEREAASTAATEAAVAEAMAAADAAIAASVAKSAATTTTGAVGTASVYDLENANLAPDDAIPA